MQKDQVITSFSGNYNTNNLKALVFDLLYDRYRGVIVYLRVFNGKLKKKQKIKLLGNQKVFQVEKLGVKIPEEIEKEFLNNGEIGWFTANIRNIKDAQVGDTVIDFNDNSSYPLPGYQKLKPNIYSNFYPSETSNFQEFKKALIELQLQDSALTLENIESNILGLGYCCGFLGLLHRDVIRERIQSEYKIELIITNPSVNYLLVTKNGQIIEIANPQKMPDWNQIKEVKELFIKLIITVPHEYIGNINDLCHNKRGIYLDIKWKTDFWCQIIYELPFAEFIVDFTDQLKSLSRGFASFEYHFTGYRIADIVRVDILLNKQLIPDLSFLVHQQFSRERSKEICLSLKETLNKQNFVVPIQACVGNKVIARETLPALKKNVTGNLYGGDRTRRMKLWEKQKKGKERMQKLGKLNFTNQIFRNLLSWKK